MNIICSLTARSYWNWLEYKCRLKLIWLHENGIKLSNEKYLKDDKDAEIVS